VSELLNQLQYLPQEANDLDVPIVSNGGDGTMAWRIVSLVRETTVHNKKPQPLAAGAKLENASTSIQAECSGGVNQNGLPLRRSRQTMKARAAAAAKETSRVANGRARIAESFQ
jgi:hypothetical protein